MASRALEVVGEVGRMDLADHLPCDLEWVASSQSVSASLNTMKSCGFKDMDKRFCTVL